MTSNLFPLLLLQLLLTCCQRCSGHENQPTEGYEYSVDNYYSTKTMSGLSDHDNTAVTQESTSENIPTKTWWMKIIDPPADKPTAYWVQWMISPAGQGGRKQCLSVGPNAVSDPSLEQEYLYLYPCQDPPKDEQIWHMILTWGPSYYYYMMESVARPGLCVVPNGQQKADGTKLVIWNCDKLSADGYYTHWWFFHQW